MKTKAPTLALPVSMMVAALALASSALANPLGEQVVAGQVTFDRNGALLTVEQMSNNAIVNWQEFGVAAGETTRFNQSGAGVAILNRVVGGTMSEIQGRIEANGKVFLINPHGVVVGSGGVVQTNGFVGSTLDVPDAEFLAGGDMTFKGNSGAAVVNKGTVSGGLGDVILVGRKVNNEGTLEAPNGTVAMAAGNEVLVTPAGSNRVGVVVGDTDAKLENSGVVQGAVAELRTNGGNGYALAINNGGVVKATGASTVNGRVILDGGTSDVLVEGSVQATNANGTGGEVDVTGARVNVQGSISADGTSGGKIRLGGGREGKDTDIVNAKKVYIGENATVSAKGTAGNGGEVIAYAKDSLQAYGLLSARGTGGKGGFIETSGGLFDIGTNVPDIAGTTGGGTWLIDPYNITIVAGGGNTNINGSTPFESNNTSAQLGVSLITTALGSGNVVITTGSGGGEAGDIILNTDLNFNGIGTGRTLTLNAHRNVTLNNQIYDSSAGGDSLNIVFNSDSDNNGLGASILYSNIATGGGNLTFNSALYMGGGSAQTLNVGTGNMTFNKQVQLANTSGITLTTNGGTILFSDALDSGNTYAYDSTTRTWQAAFSAVKTGTGASAGDTYLATLTSALENSIAQSTLPAATSAWLGGNDTANEGDWRWVAGPEGLENSGNGRPFWSGSFNGSPVNGQYSNWVPGGEPNDSGGAEDALQIGFGSAGEWNDFPINSSLLGSVVETNRAPTNLTVNVGTGGTVTFNGAVGADKQLGNLTVNSGGTVNINHNFTSAGTVDLDSAAGFGSANRTLTANSLVFRKAVTGTANGNAWLADTMDLQEAIGFGTNTLRLAQRTNGRVINLISAGAGVDLSGAELGRITAQGLIIGNANSGNMTITDSINLANVTNLMLESGGTITDDSGAILTTNGLGLRAGGAITLDNQHNVNTLAIHNTAANSVFIDSDGFSIGSFSGFADGITATGRNVGLSAGGAVTQANAIIASGLELMGSNGEWTLTNAGNNIATLAANTKSVNYLDSNALSIGSVNGTTGINNTGAVQVRTASGNLTVDQNVVAGGGGNSIVLAAGAAFDNNRGAGALTAGTGGRYLIYSSTPGATDLDGLTPGRQYNKTFGGNAPGTIGGTGSQVLYNYNPVLTFTAQTTSHVYGSPAYTYTVSGYETGDDATTAYSGVPTLAPAAGNYNAGTRALTINSTGLTNLQGYTFNFVNGNVTITPAPLTITADSFSRQYANANPTFTAKYNGLVNGDTAASITGLIMTTPAVAASPEGTYAITAAGGTNSNYTITHVDGVLTVLPFKQAQEVLKMMTTNDNAPGTTTTPVSAPEPQGSSTPIGTLAMGLPMVNVVPPESGITKVEGGTGQSLSQYSSLDMIEEGNRDTNDQGEEN